MSEKMLFVILYNICSEMSQVDFKNNSNVKIVLPQNIVINIYTLYRIIFHRVSSVFEAVKYVRNERLIRGYDDNTSGRNCIFSSSLLPVMQTIVEFDSS